MCVFAALAVLATVAQVNPIWLFVPYNPPNVSNGSQPDWYIGFLEGALRLIPNVETNPAPDRGPGARPAQPRLPGVRARAAG